MTADDIVKLVLAGNTAALSWAYAARGVPPPGTTGVSVNNGSLSASVDTSTLLLLGAVVLGVFLFTRR